MTEPDLKQCSLCREAKPRDAFSSAPSAKDGLDHRCRDCRRELMRAYRTTAAGRSASNAAARRSYAQRRAQHLSPSAA